MTALLFICCEEEHMDRKGVELRCVINGTDMKADLISIKGETNETLIKLCCDKDWSIKTAPSSWLEVMPTSGKGDAIVSILTKTNLSTDYRVGTIVASCNDGNTTLPVVQEGTWFEISEDTLHFDSTIGLDSVRIRTNVTCDITASETWIKAFCNFVEEDSYIIIETTENLNNGSRLGYVYISSAIYSHTISIIQDGKKTNAYIDLGLPSGLLWATHNLGASVPEEFGNYYAWGETSTKNDYTLYTYIWYDKKNDIITKYYNSSGSQSNLELSDDAAFVEWGDNWHIPTNADWEELLNNDNCIWEWTNQNNMDGCKVTSRSNGNSLFLPAAGYYSGEELLHAGEDGLYWTSSSNQENAWYMDLKKLSTKNTNNRCLGFTIRPVRN